MAACLVARRYGLALFMLASTIALAGCERNINVDEVETVIQAGLLEQIQVKFASVSCPKPRPMKAGDEFDCKAVAETGGDVTVKVTQKDDTGNISWKLVNGEKVLSLKAIEEQVRDAIAKQLKVDAAIDCGGTRRVAEAGKTFECTAKAGTESRAVIVTMDDDKGNVSWALK